MFHYAHLSSAFIIMSSAKKLRRNPTIICYRDVQELIILKDWFFNFDKSKDNRYKAIQKVKALSSRGKLPHAIESTSLLTSIILTDPVEGGDNKDSNVLQLSYTMALIRFVNGLLDPFQQSNFAIPLHQLAKNLNLPSFFVELRHMGTHESLPNLNILRLASKQAVNWLYDNYWNIVEETPSDLEDDENDNDRAEINRLMPIIENVILNLKSFKKIRKQDLNQVFKYGNSSESGIKYWKAIGNLKKVLNDDMGIVIKVLIYKNFMIYNNDKLITKEPKKFKFNLLLIKLYKPLIDELGNEFKLNLLFDIFHSLQDYVCDDVSAMDIDLGFQFKHGDEIRQIREWAIFLIDDLLLSQNVKSETYQVTSFTSLVHLIIAKFQKVDIVCQLLFMQVLQSFLEKTQSISQSRKDLYLQVSTNYKQLKIEFLAPPPSLDDILTSSSKEESTDRPSKKQKINLPAQPDFLFETHKEWIPRPFGVA